MITSKEFIARIMSGVDVTGMYVLTITPEMYGFVPGSGTLKIWGYYPYRLEKTAVFSSGKLFLYLTLVNKLGTQFLAGEIDTLRHGRPYRVKMNRRYTFYETEEEAIAECHSRNTGKRTTDAYGYSYNLTQVQDERMQGYAEKYY
jgi:hypothetical protein